METRSPFCTAILTGACIANSPDNSESTSIATKHVPAVRILCLGNELLADDSLGCVAANHLQPLASPEVEIISTSESGVHLLDYVLGVRRLVVIDAVQRGMPPGTIHEFHENELQSVGGGSPHYIGLLETLTLARHLGLPVAEEITILTVEAADCLTLGGALHPRVSAAIPVLTGMVRDVIRATP